MKKLARIWIDAEANRMLKAWARANGRTCLWALREAVLAFLKAGAK